MKDKKIRFTFVDLIIAAAVLAVGISACIKLMDFEPPAKETELTLRIYDQHVKDGEVPSFKAGDRIYIGDVTAESAGVVDYIETENTRSFEQDKENGAYVESESDVYKTVYVGVSVKAKDNGINYECGESTVKVGMNVVVKGENGSFEGTILDLERK